MDKAEGNRKYLKFNFDISTFKLLGRELITDRITALFELVKNSYDANADHVVVEFLDVNPISANSKIIIRDDGIGMDLNDIENKWMVIGTASKRVTRVSPKPYNRILVGKKGVGRFAVDKLGSKLLLSSKKFNTTRGHHLEMDWSKYEAFAHQQLRHFGSSKNTGKKFFTDVDNLYWHTDTTDKKRQGTTLEISMLNDPWTEEDVSRAYAELSKLISPLKKVEFPFSITINAPQYEQFKERKVKSNAVGISTVEFYLKGDKKNKTQEIIQFEGGKLQKVKSELRPMGPVNFQLYYFDLQDKKKFQKKFPGAKIDGIKVYRDNLITTPFAQYTSVQDEARDVLGIDKRRWSGFFEKVSSRDLLGFVEITDADNPEIIDSTNRQDFVDNKAYRELKKFIIEQLVQLENYLKYVREHEAEKTKSNLKSAKVSIKTLTDAVKQIKDTAPPRVKQQLATLERHAKKVEIEIKKGIADYNRLEKEQVEQKNLFLSLMSLQDYAAEIAHVVRTSLSKILRHAEFLKKNFPNPKYSDLYLKYVTRIFDEMNKLNKAVDFMLSYASSNTDFTEINIRTLVEDLFYRHYEHIFRKEKIHVSVEIRDSIQVTHNRKFFEDIFENLISNSIKALKGRPNKTIKCTGFAEGDKYVILFSDNGPGILSEDRRRIFNIYYTTTAEQGGAGIGLYIVKTRIESMKGTIEVVKNELLPTGATFKIVLPFASNSHP